LKPIIDKVQVNIPFGMFFDGYLELFESAGLNPEICMGGDSLEQFSKADFEKIARVFKNSGRTITFHGPFADMVPGSQDPGFLALTRKRLDQMIALIDIFEPLTIVCHFGYDYRRHGYYREDWLATSLETWREAGEKISRAGSRLMLENVYETDPGQILPLFKELAGADIGLCFDVGHHFAFGTVSMDAWLTQLGPYLGQFHLHDNSGAEDEHRALGQGAISLAPLFDYLRARTDNPPVLTIEPHRVEDLIPSLEYLREKLM
ncbi:MAG: sugar phosphate isomerase/epimerase, partial [Desulfobacterales bacterium]|nr:sugar phosphate isomerase/epimerase [Desulfobacterales bacterium]